jgi:hypothetical protein
MYTSLVAGKANEFESSGNSIDGWLISGKRAPRFSQNEWQIFSMPYRMLFANYIFF